MSELKTIKDMDIYKEGGNTWGCKSGTVDVEELRQLAIKWVKEDIEEYRNLFKDVLNGKEIKSPTMKLINKWKDRLNITEKDLK